jgi:hypothetical protein
MTAIEPILRTAPLGNGGIRWSGGSITMLYAGLVRITTDEGLTGLHETYGGDHFAPKASKAVVGACPANRT